MDSGVKKLLKKELPNSLPPPMDLKNPNRLKKNTTFCVCRGGGGGWWQGERGGGERNPSI